MKSLFRAACASLVLAIGVAAPASAADVFQITTPAFGEAGALPLDVVYDKIGTDGTPCGGKNASPPAAWTGAPAGTASYAVMLTDPDGALGVGAVHWLVYNIAPTVTSLPANAAAMPTPPFTAGKLVFPGLAYRGPCPPKGQSTHHYLLTVFALDVPPTLAPQLDRTGFLAAVDKHILRISSISALYAR